MDNIAIMTDSNSGVTQEQAVDMGIKVLPMPFLIDGETYFEDINLTQEQFYQKLAQDVEISTSQPSPEAVMDRIVPNYVVGFVYGALVESYSCEQNARMMAMEAASKSARDMLNELDILYNRARQAAITQEITEVIAGAKSQKKKRK